MTAFILISGTLFRAPEERISKSGKPFWSAIVRVKDGDTAAWWKILCFSEAGGAELMRLGDGDALSAQGAFKAEPYEKNGETRVGLTFFVDHILPLKPAPKERKSKADKPAQRRDDWPRVDDDLNDQVPF